MATNKTNTTRSLPWGRLVKAPLSSSTTGRVWRYFATKEDAERCTKNACGPVTYRPHEAWSGEPGDGFDRRSLVGAERI